MTIIIRHLIIHGRVQGVGYRAWAADAARQRGLTGWVRNRREGTVEAMFAGPEPEVLAMISACRTGPPRANVTRIEDRVAAASELAAGRESGVFLSLPTV